MTNTIQMCILKANSQVTCDLIISQVVSVVKGFEKNFKNSPKFSDDGSRHSVGGEDMEGRRKVYVSVNADFNPEGRCRPKSITFEDGQLYEIDKVLQACRAASTRVGGTGIRYTISIFGRQTFLFNEKNGRWFVEAKC